MPAAFAAGVGLAGCCADPCAAGAGAISRLLPGLDDAEVIIYSRNSSGNTEIHVMTMF